MKVLSTLLFCSIFLSQAADVFTKRPRNDYEYPEPTILVIKSSSNILRTLEDNIRRSVERKTKEDWKREELLEKQQKHKRDDIMEFLKDRYLTTNYFYDEMNRIKRQRKVMDPLRRMVEFLEHPENIFLKRKVLRLYYRYRPQLVKEKEIYNYETNNLVINVKKDPFNHGVYP